MKCSQWNAMLFLFVVALHLAGNCGSAAILSNFEGGATDYDSAAAQTTGKFRDTASGPFINISSNGSGNDFLSFTNTGGNRPSTVYDLSPSNTSPYSLFLTPVGLTTQITVDVQFPSSTLTFFTLGILDPTAGTTNRGVAFEFRDQAGATQDQIALRYLPPASGEGIQTPGADIQVLTNTGSAVVNPIIRMTLNFLNNGSSATITGNATTISALEGTVGATLATLTPQTINYGTGAGQLNLSPATSGFEILLGRNNSGVTDVVRADLLTLTVVPEPGSFSMMLFASVMLWAVRRKRIVA